METSKPYYRPDIDGLRAVAIISVVLFHAGFTSFSGGFVGVDIFFVISGFLIASIILRELQDGTFSFFKFFERRVRRILPALLLVTGVTILLGYKLLLYPGEFAELNKSVFAMSVFLSNVFFLRKIDYFTSTTEQFPLLHTWTLAVEEQFYIIFPILLFFIFRLMRRHVTLLFALLALASFCCSIYLVNIAPGNNFSLPLLPDVWGGSINKAAGFYLLTSRAWEFLCGVIIACTKVTIQSRRLSEVSSLFGGGLLLFSITQFSTETAFPGVLALLPIAGCVMIIISTHEKTLVGKFLSLRPMVWTGLISYSLYLWHWPIFVFAKVAFVELSLLGYWLLILLALLLSYVTYVLVETPLRKLQQNYSSRVVVLVGIVALLLCAALSFSLRYLDINPRTPWYGESIIEASSYGELEKNCLIDKQSADYLRDGPCYIGAATSTLPVSFVLWGDSHAGTLIDTLDMIAKKHQARGAVFTSSACAPIAGTSSWPPREECETINQLALAFIAKERGVTVVIAAKWNTYLGYEPIAPKQYLLVDTESKEVSPAESNRVIERGLLSMIKEMGDRHQQIVILKQVPKFDTYNSRTAFYTAAANDKLPELPTVTLTSHLVNHYQANLILDRLSASSSAKVIDPAESFCRAGTCLMEKDGTILYRDSSHVNEAGSRLLTKQLEVIFE